VHHLLKPKSTAGRTPKRNRSGGWPKTQREGAEKKNKKDRGKGGVLTDGTANPDKPGSAEKGEKRRKKEK